MVRRFCVVLMVVVLFPMILMSQPTVQLTEEELQKLIEISILYEEATAELKSELSELRTEVTGLKEESENWNEQIDSLEDSWKNYKNEVRQEVHKIIDDLEDKIQQQAFWRWVERTGFVVAILVTLLLK